MSIVAVIVRIMPDSPDANLEDIKAGITKYLESEGAKNITFTEEEIAFGLKAILAKFAWIEEKSTDLVENNLIEIEHVSSVKIEDYRRAFG